MVSHCINIFTQISTRVPATWYCRWFVSLSWPNIHGKSRCFCGPECRHHGWLSFTGVCWISPAASGWTFNPGYRGKNLDITAKIVIILLLLWNLCLAVILLQIVIVLVSPGTHLVKCHESKSRTNESQFKKQQIGTFVTRQLIWRKSPKLFNTVYCSKLKYSPFS